LGKGFRAKEGKEGNLEQHFYEEGSSGTWRY